MTYESFAISSPAARGFKPIYSAYRKGGMVTVSESVNSLYTRSDQKFYTHQIHNFHIAYIVFQ